MLNYERLSRGSCGTRTCVHCTSTEAGSKEKRGVWDSMPELTIISPNVHFRVQSRLQHIFHGQPYARVDLKHMSESTLSNSQ
jgi:hypothetical protein